MIIASWNPLKTHCYDRKWCRPYHQLCNWFPAKLSSLYFATNRAKISKSPEWATFLFTTCKCAHHSNDRTAITWDALNINDPFIMKLYFLCLSEAHFALVCSTYLSLSLTVGKANEMGGGVFLFLLPPIDAIINIFIHTHNFISNTLIEPEDCKAIPILFNTYGDWTVSAQDRPFLRKRSDPYIVSS